MNKRGQYYLVAAIIFIGIIFILISVVNQSKKETNTRIYELSKEMKIESSKVMEYSVNTGNTANMEDFTKEYSEYAGQGINIYFITGNRAAQEVYNYTNGLKNTIPSSMNGNTLETTIEGMDHSFEFEKGENFYFIITQNEGDEKYILEG